MKLSCLPLLQIQRDLYAVPRGVERDAQLFSLPGASAKVASSRPSRESKGLPASS